MADEKLSFFEKIKSKEERALRQDFINKKNQEMTTMLVIFYVAWIGAGIYIVDFLHTGNIRTLALLAWSFSILIPCLWK